MGWQLIWRRLQTSSRWRSRFFRGTIAFLICLTSHRSFALANRRTVCPLQAVGSVGSDAEAATKFALGVEMLMESAAKMSSQGEHEKALGALASAEELLEAAGSPDNLAAGYFMQRGATFAHLKRFGETLQEFGRARDIFKKHNDMKNPEIVTVSGNMAIAASAIGRRKDAMLFFNEASEILDALGDDQMKAYILSSMGAACVGAGAFEQGFSHMKQAQKVAVAGQTICKHSQWTFTTIRQNALLKAGLGDTPEGALLLSQMGSILYQMAIYSQASLHFDFARDRYFKNGDLVQTVWMWYLSNLSSFRGWLWDTEQSLYQ
ncbi:unnamed protein product [Durusdinium trenchii]|uniref:Uncharacterized protein n=2 Tax=Durusdinium trenchii TaxID=1381693 RepID=A0ABP0SIP5_9DINO